MKADFPSAEEIVDKAKANTNAVDLDDVNLYDELKETAYDEGEDKQAATKNLSLKLLDTKTPQQVLTIFESDFVRSPEKVAHGEELVMILKFLQHNLNQSMEREEAQTFIQSDARVGTLIEWLMNRYEGIELEY